MILIQNKTKYNYYLPFGVVLFRSLYLCLCLYLYLSLSLSFWAVSNLADVCFDESQLQTTTQADMAWTEDGISEMNDTLKPIEPVDISFETTKTQCELIGKSNGL